MQCIILKNILTSMLFRLRFKKKKDHLKVLFAWNLYGKCKKKEIFTWTWSYHMNCWPSTSMRWYRLPSGDADSSKASSFPIRHLVKPTATKDLKDSSFFSLCILKHFTRTWRYSDSKAPRECCQAIFLCLSDDRALAIFKAPWAAWKSQRLLFFLSVLEWD